MIMISTPAIPTSQHQILVNLGNRYAVFGPRGIPSSIQFDPNTDSETLDRVPDEIEFAAPRIAQSLRVAGMKRCSPPDGTSADLQLIDEEGNCVLVEIKVREGDPKPRDYDQAREHLTEAARRGEAVEIWHFNIERLKLAIMRMEKSRWFRVDDLSPLDVWKKTQEGIARRSSVVEEVEDWVRRVHSLYGDIRHWLNERRPDLECEETRTVTMSEEPMQEFAVPDRELPILDVLREGQVIASFVPRGLWLLGAWGRIDMITHQRTLALLALGGLGALQWSLVVPENPPRRVRFDREAMLMALGQT